MGLYGVKFSTIVKRLAKQMLASRNVVLQVNELGYNYTRLEKNLLFQVIVSALEETFRFQ